MSLVRTERLLKLNSFYRLWLYRLAHCGIFTSAVFYPLYKPESSLLQVQTLPKLYFGKLNDQIFKNK